jgi:general secretion pathway protein G
MFQKPRLNRRLVLTSSITALLLVLGGIQARGGPLANLKAGANKTQVQADFQSIRNALDMYKLTAGNYPTAGQGLKALVEKPTTAPKPARWTQFMKSEPLDPWKNPYSYKFPGTQKADEPEIISTGPDGIKGTADDLRSQDK